LGRKEDSRLLAALRRAETGVADNDAAAQDDTDPAAFLRHISDAVHVGAVPQPNDMSRMASALDRILTGEAADTAFGFKPKRGQRTSSNRTRLDQRNRLLSEAATRLYGGLPKAAQAQRLHTQLTRYRANAWERERSNEAPPGTANELFWRALKCHDRELSVRTLRLILATS
jgi:hypothetical protein